MTTPTADKTSEDQRRQDREGKKDKPSIDESLLEGVHRLRRFNGRNRFARNPPLDKVSNHEQIKEDEGRPTPAAGFRFTHPALRQSQLFRLLILTTAFHKLFVWVTAQQN